MANSYQSALDYGINPSGPNVSNDINAILAANSNFSGIIFDFPPGTIVILDGDIQANGKVMQFQAGTILTSDSEEKIITGAQIDAGYLQQCFDLSITLVNCTTSADMFSVCWYGAGINPIDNSQPALQKASDTVIANFSSMTRTLYMPRLIYRIELPWILHRWIPPDPANPEDEGLYQQWTLNILGDYNIENSNVGNGAARIITNDDQNFAIGVQRAWCGSIIGISVEGPFTQELTFDQLVTTDFTFARTERYSPNAGIVIDPFTAKDNIVNDDFYPSLEQWYQGPDTNGGTRGFTIANCNIQGFTVNILNSPNTRTQMGEDCIIDSCRLNFAQIGIAYCQDQSENCVIRNIRSIYSTWITIDGSTYGRRRGVVGHVSNINVSFPREIFNINQVEPLLIEKVYSEGAFAIGRIQSSPSTSMVNGCAFHLNHDSPLQPQIHLDSFNVEFNSCSISYNGEPFNSRRIRLIGGRTKFVNVDFDLPPYQIPWPSSAQNWGFVFDNCRVLTTATLGMNNTMYNLNIAQSTAVAYGNFKIQNNLGLDEANLDKEPRLLSETFHYNCSNYNRVVDHFATHVTIVPDNDRRCEIFNINTDRARVNDIVIEHLTKQVVGRITSITSSSIVISEIPLNIIQYTDVSIHLVYFLTIANPIIGDIEEGVPEIHNVSYLFNFGYLNYNLAPGFRFDHHAFPLGTYILEYDDINRVLKMSQPARKTAIRQNFLNGNPRVEVSCMLPPTSQDLGNHRYAFPNGTIWTEIISHHTASISVPIEWVCNKGGYLNSASSVLNLPPPVAPYQAEFYKRPRLRLENGVIEYYDESQDIWVPV